VTDGAKEPSLTDGLVLDPWWGTGLPLWDSDPVRFELHKWNYLHDLKTNSGRKYDDEKKRWVDSKFNGSEQFIPDEPKPKETVGVIRVPIVHW
jgi:hypothetical protein